MGGGAGFLDCAVCHPPCAVIPYILPSKRGCNRSCLTQSLCHPAVVSSAVYQQPLVPPPHPAGVVPP